MNSNNLFNMIEKEGWYLVRTKGSHHYFEHPAHKGLVNIPHLKKDVPKGTVKSILRQAGIE